MMGNSAMLKMLTAFTDEVDDAEFAVREILDQLDLNKNLRKNSVGILFCYTDFIGTGVMKAVCEALPFAVVGCTTMANSATQGAGMAALSLGVLTSDQVQFSAIRSSPLTDTPDASVREAFYRGKQGHGEDPALIIAFAPLQHTGGEVMADAVFTVAENIPILGLVACDHTLEYENSYTIFNGSAEKDSASMVFIYGDIRPRFFLKVISDEKIQKQKAIITDSEGGVLREVNGMPLMQYMEMLGVSKNNGIENIGVVPFILKYTDGTPPVARAIYKITPEGHAECGGKMPVGATLAVGRLDMDDILKTAWSTVTEAMNDKTPNALLMFPCMSRDLALGADYLAEIDIIQKTVGKSCPYLLAYAGGELCPDFDDSGKLINRFHNFTFIACAL